MKHREQLPAADCAAPARSVEAAKDADGLRPKKPRRLRFFARSCGYVAAGLLVLTLISGAFLVARLTQGPMAINGLGPLIASALDQRFGRGYDFSLGRVSMIKHGVSPTLSVDGLSLKDRSGRTIFTAPRAEVSVDPLSLIGGRVVPRRLEVFDVEVRLALLPDGSIAQPIAPGSDETVALTPPLAESLVKEGASPGEIGASQAPLRKIRRPTPAVKARRAKPRRRKSRALCSSSKWRRRSAC